MKTKAGQKILYALAGLFLFSLIEVNPLFPGVFYTILGEIALLTPPVGVNLFVIQKQGGCF